MNNVKKNGSEMVTLRVTSIKVWSGEPDDFDSVASEFLQNAGFQHLKKERMGCSAKAPDIQKKDDDTFFLVEYSSSGRVLNLPVSLFRLKEKKLELIETGRIICAELRPDKSDEYELEVTGDSVKSLTIIATVADEKLIAERTEAGLPADKKRQAPEIKKEKEKVYSKFEDQPVRVIRTNVQTETTPPVFPKVTSPITKPPQAECEPVNPPSPEVIMANVNEIVVFQPNTVDPRFSGQPRRFFNTKKLLNLGISMRHNGQKMLIIVKPLSTIPGKKWELVDGERRWRAAQLVGITHLKAEIQTLDSKKEQHRTSLIANLNRENHTLGELSDALQEQILSGETVARLVEDTGLSRATIDKYLRLQLLHPELRKLCDEPTPVEERIRLNEGSVLSRAPLDLQVKFWEESKNLPTRGLILERLHQLAKPYFQYKSEGNRHDGGRDTARSVTRRIAQLERLVAELNGLPEEKLQKYIEFMDTELGINIASLNKVSKEISAFRLKISLTTVGQRMRPPVFDPESSFETSETVSI